MNKTFSMMGKVFVCKEKYLNVDAALEAVVCNAMLQDDASLLKLYKGKRTLFERVMDWVREFLGEIKATGAALAKRNADWKQMDALKGQREMMQGMMDRMTEIMNGEAETEIQKNHSAVESGMAASGKYSLKDTKKMSWADQVKRTRAGNIVRSATLSPAKSGKVFGSFGMSELPIGVNIRDLNKMIRDPKGSKSAHSLSEDTVLALEKELDEPNVAFENSSSDCIYVVTIQKDKNGNPVVAIISKDQEDPIGEKMHRLISEYGMVNPIQYILDHLKTGDKFYAKNNEALLQAMAGAQHIMDAADIQLLEKRFTRIKPQEETDVNDKFSRKATDSEGNALTEAQQEYFADSKVRDKSGALKVMHHGTANEFTVFNPMLQGGKNGVAEGYGIYFTDTASITDAYGGKKLSGYLNITNPASSTKKTIKANMLAKLIEATCEAEAEKFVADGDYDTKAEALKDTWVSNYEYTYDSPMSVIYRKVANSIIAGEDSDMGIIQEVMAGTAVRDYEGAYQFYDILRDTMGIDGFITEWDNAEIPGGKAMIALAFNSNQFKNLDNQTPTLDPDIRYSRKGLDPEADAMASETEKAFEQVRDAYRITAWQIRAGKTSA